MQYLHRASQSGRKQNQKPGGGACCGGIVDSEKNTPVWSCLGGLGHQHGSRASANCPLLCRADQDIAQEAPTWPTCYDQVSASILRHPVELIDRPPP